jgi:hypothetical protein
MQTSAAFCGIAPMLSRTRIHPTISATRRQQHPSSRMRDAGGFRAPPVVPPPGPARERAVELLGACTQRSPFAMRGPARAELAALVGGAPGTCEAAQQWKGALMLVTRREARARNPQARTRLARTVFMDMIRLPATNAQTSRAFVLLEVLRRRYWAGQAPSETLMESVVGLIGFAPKDASEVFRANNALRRLQHERRSAERRPPVIPETDEDLRLANMLLGQFANTANVGSAQTPVLEHIVGSLPRTPQVARSWQKHIQIVIRKRARATRVAANLAVANKKRTQRGTLQKYNGPTPSTATT